jgi:hypothetical protein
MLAMLPVAVNAKILMDIFEWICIVVSAFVAFVLDVLHFIFHKFLSRKIQQIKSPALSAGLHISFDDYTNSLKRMPRNGYSLLD